MFFSFFNKRRIIISYAFSSKENGNVIIINNLDKNAITIVGYDLFWSKKGQQPIYINTGMEEGCLIKILPYEYFEHLFIEQYYFNWGEDCGKLYIELRILGRKHPLIEFVYPAKN